MRTARAAPLPQADDPLAGERSERSERSTWQDRRVALDRALVLYVIDEATDEVAATIYESARLAGQLHLWQGPEPSAFDAIPDGLRTVGVGLRFTDPFPTADQPGLIRLLEYLTVASQTLGVCLEVQLDGTPIGLVAPEGIQPWVAETLRAELGLADAG